MSLASILDQIQVMFRCERFQFLHVAWIAIEMNWQYRFRTPGNRSFNQLGIDIACDWVSIHKDRRRPCLQNSIGGRDEAKRRRNHLVARSYFVREQGQV